MIRPPAVFQSGLLPAVFIHVAVQNYGLIGCRGLTGYCQEEKMVIFVSTHISPFGRPWICSESQSTYLTGFGDLTSYAAAANREAPTWSSRYCHHLAPPPTAAEWCPVRAWCSIALHAPCTKPYCRLVALPKSGSDKGQQLPPPSSCQSSLYKIYKAGNSGTSPPSHCSTFPNASPIEPSKSLWECIQLQGQLRGGFFSYLSQVKAGEKIWQCFLFEALEVWDELSPKKTADFEKRGSSQQTPSSKHQHILKPNLKNQQCQAIQLCKERPALNQQTSTSVQPAHTRIQDTVFVLPVSGMLPPDLVDKALYPL